MTSPLESLCGPNKPLRREPPDAQETEGLLRTGRARLKDAANPALALESRFDLAYNAAHALSLAALRQRGPPRLPSGKQRESDDTDLRRRHLPCQQPELA